MPPAELAELPESVREHPWRAPLYCPADFNKDDSVDGSDADLFLSVFATRAGPMTAWLDLTGDSAVDGDDVACFFNAFSAGDCGPGDRAALRDHICKTLADHQLDHATVTIADGMIYVSANGLSIEADARQGGTITSMSMVEVSVSRLYLDIAQSIQVESSTSLLHLAPAQTR